MGYLDNIPHELRAHAQWMLAGDDKEPLAVDPASGETYRGAKNRSDQWMTYDEARHWAETLGYRMGYVPRETDPFTIIDLDWKEDRVYDVEASGIKQDLYQNAIGSTYVELSSSGKGAHIVVEGKLPHDFNARNAGIECYGNLGFVVITGHQVSASNRISNQQPVLNWLGDKYRNAVEASRFNELAVDQNLVHNAPAEEVALDDALIASMSTWHNAANLERYFYGRDLRPDGGGGSEGDLALMQAFMKFSRSEDKLSAAMRMYLKTPRAKLRQPFKMATSNWDQYLKRTLLAAQSAVARDEKMARNYDFAEGSRAMLAEYEASIKAAQQPEPASAPNSGQAPIAGAPAPFTGFAWLTKSDLEKLPPIQWVVKGLFPVGGLGAIYGESGAGKSFVGIDMIAHIAEGKQWFGLRTTQLPVSVFALEGEGGLKGRVAAWELQNQRAYPQSVFFWDSARNGSFALRDADQRQTFNRDRLIQLCADLKMNGRAGGVVVIDTLNQASDGADENSSRDMGELLKAMKFIARETGSLVLIVHHATKSKENQSMRGHSSLYGAMDGVMEVRREVVDEMTGDPIAGRRAWEAKKVKDGRDGFERYFDMKEHQIGFDEDGPMMSVAIEPVSDTDVDPQTGEITHVNVGTTKKLNAVKKRRAGSDNAPSNNGSTWSKGERAHIEHPTGAGGDSWNGMKPQDAIRRAVMEECAAARTAGRFGGDSAHCAPRNAVIERAIMLRNYPNPSLSKRDLNRAVDAMIGSGKLGSEMESGKHQWIWLKE